MNDQGVLGALEADEEYRAIEAALLETPRGRWFLTEHGRRSRRIDSRLLNEAIHQLQTSLRDPPALLSVLRSDVERLRAFIASQRNELANHDAARLASIATASSASQAANMLTAAEDLHALVWSMRDQVPNPEFCEAIGRQASRIYAMSHAQASESARAQQYTVALDEMYQRLSALLETIVLEMQGGSSEPRGYLPSRSASPLPR